MKYIVDSSALTDIANAIRKKRGTSAPINFTDMASEILLINSGGTRPIIPQTGTWQLKATTDKKYVILGTDDDVAGNPKYFRLLRTYGFPYTMNMEAESIGKQLGSDVDDTLFISTDAPSVFPQSVTTEELGKYIHDNNLGEVAQHGSSTHRLWDSTKIADSLWNTWHSDYTSKGGSKSLADFKQAVISGCADSDTYQGAAYVEKSRLALEDKLGFFIDTVGIWGGNPSCVVDGITVTLSNSAWGDYNWRADDYAACSSTLQTYIDNTNPYDIHRDSSNLAALSILDRVGVGKAIEMFVHNTMGLNWTTLRQDLNTLKALVDNGEVEVVTRKQYAGLGEYVDNPITKIDVTRTSGTINVGEEDSKSEYTVIATFADGATRNVTDECIIKLADTSEPNLIYVPAYYKGFTDTVLVEVVQGSSSILEPYIYTNTKLSNAGAIGPATNNKVLRYDVSGLNKIYFNSSHNHGYIVGWDANQLASGDTTSSIGTTYYNPNNNPNEITVPSGMNYVYFNSTSANGYDVYPWVISK